MDFAPAGHSLWVPPRPTTVAGRSRWLRLLVAVAAVLPAAFIPLARQDVPWADEIVRSTAQQVGFVEFAGPPLDPAAPEEPPGRVWFLTVSERRLSVLEQVLGAHRPQVVQSEAVGRFDADGDFMRSQRLAYELAIRLDPHSRVVVGTAVVGAPDLHEGDELLLVDGRLVESLEDAERRIRRWRLRRSCGECTEALRLTVRRGEQTLLVEVPVWRRHRVEIPLARRPSAAVPPVGDARGGTYEGGSAGLAFTVAYLDRLAGGDLLAGRSVAATGVIDETGRVGPVGRVAEKLEAAAAAGAEVVFVPMANTAEALRDPPVPVVPVDHATDVVRWLCADRGSRCADLRLPGSSSSTGEDWVPNVWMPLGLTGD